MCEIRIGTSGWHYDHWLGMFYPDKLPKNQWFEHYSRQFNTVEVNNDMGGHAIQNAQTLKRLIEGK